MPPKPEQPKSRTLAIETFIRTKETLLATILKYTLKNRAAVVAGELLRKFRTYDRVLAADFGALRSVPGMTPNAAILLKLVDYTCTQRIKNLEAQKDAPASVSPAQNDANPVPIKKSVPYAQVELTLLNEQPLGVADQKSSDINEHVGRLSSVPRPLEIADAIPAYLKQRDEEELQYEDGAPRRKVTMFSKAILKEGIALLPSFPDTESVPEINEYLRNNLHFSAETTRKRYAGYITGRIFSKGIADKALRHFAKNFQGRQELREVCFFRFCKAEPLVIDVMNDLFLPAIGTAKLERENLRAYLVKRFGNTNYAQGCGQAIVEAMTSGGIAKADKKAVYFEFRDVLLPSFAFIIHDEFPEFGMYDISRIESGRNLKVMLWNPDRILPALYELRNRNILSKVSEIDSVRQFTLKMKLEEIVDKV
ncbi:MAG: hypothetical protein AB2L14_10205 [Candidatus Xenobiia bacterium LiM19]